MFINSFYSNDRQYPTHFSLAHFDPLLTPAALMDYPETIWIQKLEAQDLLLSGDSPVKNWSSQNWAEREGDQ